MEYSSAYLGQVVAPVPGGGAAAQDRDQAGLQALGLREQHVAEQVVVAVPLSAPVQRHQQQVRPGQESASAAADPGGQHRLAQRPGHPFQSTAARIKNIRCWREIRPRNSDSTYSLTNRSSPPNVAAVPGSDPPSRRYSAARYSPTGHPSVRRCSSATSSSPTCTPAARSSDAASCTVSDRSPAPISRSFPSARNRGVRSGGSARPAPAVTRWARGRRAPIARHGIRSHAARARHPGPALLARSSTRMPTPAAGRPSRAPSLPAGEHIEYPPVHALHRVERFGDIGEQDLRVVVRFVDRHPREGSWITVGPL